MDYFEDFDVEKFINPPIILMPEQVERLKRSGFYPGMVIYIEPKPAPLAKTSKLQIWQMRIWHAWSALKGDFDEEDNPDWLKRRRNP